MTMIYGLWMGKIPNNVLKATFLVTSIKKRIFVNYNNTVVLAI